MSPITIDIQCVGYAVKADVYEGAGDGVVLLSLIGRSSRRTKQRYRDFFPRLSKELGITTVIFDYTGHGDSPFDIEELSPARHFLEVVTVFDWINEQYPDRKVMVIGSSYGGYLAMMLTKYRQFDGLVLRAPAMYRPSDLYTLRKNEDLEATHTFRRNTEALAAHPLLHDAPGFEGRILLIVHENDEVVPKQTTDAYASALNPEVITTKGVGHSLDNAAERQLMDYDQQLIDWLRKVISGFSSK